MLKEDTVYHCNIDEFLKLSLEDQDSINILIQNEISTVTNSEQYITDVIISHENPGCFAFVINCLGALSLMMFKYALGSPNVIKSAYINVCKESDWEAKNIMIQVTQLCFESGILRPIDKHLKSKKYRCEALYFD